MIRTIWYDTEGSPLRMKRPTRYAYVDRGTEGWIVGGKEIGPRKGVRRQFSRRVSSLKQAQQIASGWVNYREVR